MEKTLKGAAETFADITKAADEAAINSARVVHQMDVGRVVRQGDIYIHRVADDHKAGEKVESRQLAVGNTTGSRHVAEAPASVYVGTTLPSWCEPRAFLGPCIAATGRFTVSHPEHAHVELPPGRYQITHQTDVRTMERVRD